MNVGFLILNYNSCELSIKLAQDVSSFRSIDKVVVVDNCSTDDSLIQLNKIKNEKIDVLKSEKNLGYAYGNNFGAKYCSTIDIDILFICNPDVIVGEKDIEKILNAFKESNYSMLSGVEYDIDNKIINPPIWKRAEYKDDLLECLYFGRKILRKQFIQLDLKCGIQDVALLKGSFFAVRLADFLEVGGFDENTFLFCEERILGCRMEKNDKKIGLVTGAKYIHNHSTTINKAYKLTNQIKILYNSKLYYYKTYAHISLLKKILLVIFMKVSLVEFFLVDSLRLK